MMSIKYSLTGKTNQRWTHPDGKPELFTQDGGTIDVQAAVDHIVSIVPLGTRLKITIETVDD